MTIFKKIERGIILLPLLSFASIYGYDSSQSSQSQPYAPGSNTPPPPNYPAYYTPQNNTGSPMNYPTYTYPSGYPGGYLPPTPVFPGRDNADATYKANQHPN